MEALHLKTNTTLALSKKRLGVVARSMQPDARTVKEQLYQLCSGSQMGHGLMMEQRQEVERMATQLASQQQSPLPDLKGTTWATLFTNASGGSSGKIGPFVSEVTQTFDTHLPTYCNKALFFGRVALKLEGQYSVVTAEDQSVRVDLEFTRSSVEIFNTEIYSKAFKGGEMKGHWKMLYADEEIRVFLTNRGSLFILSRRGTV
jgi:hypothetical protein